MRDFFKRSRLTTWYRGRKKKDKRLGNRIARHRLANKTRREAIV